MGWELMSHTETHPQLATLTEAEVEAELKNSKETLESMFNVKVKSIAYPNGSENAMVRRIARKYYRSATISFGGRNEMPLSTYRMNRVPLGSYYEPGAGHDTLEYYKSQVDACKANKDYLILMLHPGFP